MLQVNALKDAMKAAAQGMESAAEALTAFGNAIADHIMENAEVGFSWNGIQPGSPPAADPTVTAAGKIIGLSFALAPSQSGSQAGAITFLKSQLEAGLRAAQYNITDAGFSTIPRSMSSSPGINSLDISISVSCSDNDAVKRDSAMEQLADCIINWVKAQMPAGLILGSHGAFLAPPGSGGIVTGIN